ncbi:MAG: hypothetical protein ACR2G2_13450 [Pseudonocardia sp.]
MKQERPLRAPPASDVSALGEVIGRVQRQRSRWAAFTVIGAHIGTRAHSSRAEAAFEVVTEHRAHQTRRPRRRHGR